MNAHTFAPLDACLFDMDGTLVDTTPLVERVWTQWAERHSIDPAKVLDICHGRQAVTTMQALAPNIDLAAETQAMLQEELHATTGVTPIVGVHDFLAQLKGRPWAIVTSAAGALARKRLELCGLPIPPVLITADDTARGKPDPMGFLAGAERLGVPPARCLVFEDSLAGLQAGRRAGAQTVQICQAKPPVDPKSPVRVQDYRALRVEARPEGFAVVAEPLCP